MVRAIAYIRVSTDRQATDGTSLITQRRRVVEFVTANGYQLVRQFVEEGESAKSDNRPVLQEMLRYCQQSKGKIDLLVFPKIDRFARYSEDYHHLKRTLRELGIRIESIDERFDDTPAGRFLESLLAASAQFDNDVRSERALGGLKEAIGQGRWIWNPPVGYRKTRFGGKVTIEPDPITGRLVVKAFETLANGTQSAKEVREWLEDQGVKMSRSAFYRMIHCKLYLGQMEVFDGTYIAVPPFIPLVTESLARRARANLRLIKVPETYSRENPEFPLRGTILCECGKALTACWSQGKSNRYPYYRCRFCQNTNLPRREVEVAFRCHLDGYRSYLGLESTSVSAMRDLVRQDMEETADKHERLKKEKVDLVALQKAMVVKVAQGVIPDKIAEEHFSEIAAKLERIDIKVEQLGATTDEHRLQQVLDHARKFLGQLGEYWQRSELAEKQRLQRFLFPAGISVSIRRTPRKGLLTGSELPSVAKASRKARLTHRMANTVTIDAGASRNPDARITISFLSRLFKEFGINEQADHWKSWGGRANLQSK